MPTVGGLTTGVNAIASLNGEIYAGGHDVLGTADLAVWNGAAWAPVSLPDHGNGGSRVRDLGVHNNALYVAGEFDQPNPNDYIGVLSVEGNTRILRGAVGAGTATERSAVHMFLLSDTLYLGGTFQDVNGVPAQSLARYSGGNWSAVAPADSSIDSELLTCTVFDGALVVGGCARVLGGTEVKGIARTIDGRTFTPMGEGFAGGIYGGEVRDTVIHEGSLYAMGNFQASGATGVNNAARWDGAAWQLLGAGVGDNGPLSDDFVNVLAGCSTPQ
ncbi:MAG TPA: hypothetical protein VFF65_04585, partial [Phycisphaerales bacterium]|nr:hypothetical protein [Phycisphaerales bacterium]